MRKNRENKVAFLFAADNEGSGEKTSGKKRSPAAKMAHLKLGVRRTRATRFSAERNRPRQETTRHRIDLPTPIPTLTSIFRLNLFTNPHEYHSGDEGEYSPDHTGHDQERDYEKSRSVTTAQAYMTLTGSPSIEPTAAPEGMAQTRESQDEPSDQRRRY